MKRWWALMFVVMWGLSKTAHGGAILREVYTGISGGTISDLTNHWSYPNSPSFTNWITDAFEAPANYADNYGQRLRGYIVPPETGNYVFWISSDDYSELWLSTHAAPMTNYVRIAWVYGWTNPREWGKYGSQQSDPVYLEAGKLYAVYALMAEGWGGDNIAVRWQRPSGVVDEPIPCTHLLPPGGPFSAPQLVAQSATNPVVVENESVTFWVSVSNMYPVAHQWQRNGTNIPGASASNYTIAAVSLSDSGAVFRCVLSNSLGVVTSAPCALSVLTDTNAPLLIGAYNVGTLQVVAVFSEPLEVISGNAATNYRMSSGIVVSNAALSSDGRSATLTVSPLTLGNYYTLSVSNVRDRAAASNIIAAGANWTFRAQPFSPTAIGSATQVPASITYASNGVDVSAAGLGFGEETDAGYFLYQMQSGDFDVRVRVEGISAADMWARAGIMARESLSPESDFSAVFATPSIGGLFFEYRGTGSNLLKNASFELGQHPGLNPTNWDGAWYMAHALTNNTLLSAGKRAPAAARSGTWMLMLTNNINTSGDNWHGTGQYFPCSPGQPYLFSAYYLFPSNLPNDHYVFIKFDWYDSGYNWISHLEGERLSSRQATWTYAAVTSTAPAGAAYGKAVFVYEDKDGRVNSAGESFNAFWDDAVLKRAGGRQSVRSASRPINPPATWLRLRRVGNVFTGFYSYDNSRWTVLGSVTNALPSAIYLGLAVSSRRERDPATAFFRDWGTVTGGSTGRQVVAVSEGLGPSTRRTGLVISEIMYHPQDRADGLDLEFFELFNTEPFDIDLSGWRISGSVSYTFPTGTVLRAGAFLVLANRPAHMESVYGITGVHGPYTGGKLPNSTGTIRLRNAQNAVLLEVEYRDSEPWPLAADGLGHSLVLTKPSYGENDPRAWSASAFKGGSPGRPEPVASTVPPVVFNEILTHTDLPQVDFVELYNYGLQTVNVGRFVIRAGTNEYLIPTNTVLAPRAFLSVTETQMGFTLQKEGGLFVLEDAARTQVVDIVKQCAQQNGISWGRYRDGTPGWYALSTSTPGTTNSAIRVSDVVINEIMYHPISENSDDEYIELFNRGSSNVSLAHWRLSDGISFIFPTNVVIPAGGYLVVARNATNLIAKYPQLNATNTVGNFSGSLSDRGERIALERPEDPSIPDRAFVIVNEVTYGDGDDWGRWADGDGSSLELRDPRSDNRLAANWAGSDESAKGMWTNISVTGVLDHGNNPAGSLQILLLGEGECILDDVEAVRSSVNRVTNSTFTSNINGWLAEGNHDRTMWTASGYSGGGLHLKAEDGGDNIVNNVRTVLSSAFSAGDTVTLSAKARWVAGHPNVLIRLGGNWLELSAMLPVPPNLGTPGLVNSCYTSNAGPAISDISHGPVLPAGGESVVVSARVHDPDSVASVTLLYRLDPSTTTNTLTLRDDGTSGDAIANDGIYSGTLSGYGAGTLVAFRIRAVDSASPPRTNIWPNPATQAEALVRWGDMEPVGALGAYRFWFTQSAYRDWTNAPKLSNKFYPGTFVSGQRVIYNAGAHYRGSPFIRPMYDHPTGNVCAYRIALPKDERFLGVTTLNLDTLEPWRDNTYQRERGIFRIAEQMGLPTIASRYVRLYFNGAQRGEAYGDVHHVNADYIATWYPDNSDGEIFKLDDWFEFTNTNYLIDDGNYRRDHKDATLEKFTTTGGVLKKARYRWNWEKKSNKGLDDNYDRLFALVEAANLTNSSQYIATMQAVADIPNWATVFALRHVVCDWDGYGYARGKNGYVYKAPGLRWQMLLWDFDFGLGTSDSHPYNTPLFNEIHDPVISNRFLQTAPFRRAFLQAAKAMVNGPMQASQIGPFLQTGYQALRANGLNVAPPSSVDYWTGQRRYYLLNELAQYEAPFEITSNGGNPFSTNRNYVTLTGKAPLDVVSLSVNGVRYEPQWSSVSNWYITLTLKDATNALTIKGLDRNGNEVSGATDTIQITYTGTNISPVGWLVINEIQYNPTNAGAGFVELYNRSPTHAFDLYNYRLQGVDLTFTSSVVIPPSGFAVVVSDPVIFAATYGAIPVAAQYPGGLDNGGEWVRLLRLDGTNAPLVVCEVRYDDDPPWPTNADGLGPSLQLIDAAEDVWRVANWAVNTSVLYTPGATNNVVRDLPSFPKIWLNELQSTNASGIRDNANDRDPWVELYNQEASPWALTNFYLTDSYTNLTRWRFPTGSFVSAGGFRLVWLDNETNETAGTNYHASFRPAVTGSVALVWSNSAGVMILDYVNYGIIPVDRSYGSYPDGHWTNRVLFLYPTPNGTNNNAGAPVTVRINEWMADNASFMTDPYGEWDDWIELYNFGTQDVDLSGYWLTDNLAQPNKWSFPTGTTIAAGGFLLVWADNGHPTQTNGLHTSWALSKSGEAIGLYTPSGWVVDSLVFGTQTTDRTEGRWPDGEDNIYALAIPTPLAPNIVSTNNSAPVVDPIDPQSVAEGVPISFQVSATDTDTPPQRLTFALLAGAPAGATINSTNGWFFWMPEEADGPGTNVVRMVVTDNGWPQRAATTAVTIVVEEINSAPIVNTIPDIRLGPGSLLRLTVTGVDTDMPPNNISFSLLPGAPSGATLQSGGMFEWQPDDLDALTTNIIAVKVQDDGVPPMASTGAFVIVVGGVDEIFAAQVDSGMGPSGFTIRWNAQSGQTYQVEYTGHLLTGVWSNLGATVTATGSVATKVDESAGATSQRFYRIFRLLP